VIVLELPYPPSVNRYWRSAVIGGRVAVYINKEGRAYRALTAETVASLPSSESKAPEGRLSVLVSLYPPDRRRRDLDNTSKALLDALTHAGVYEDDDLIDRLTIERCAVTKGGKVRVCITELRETA